MQKVGKVCVLTMFTKTNKTNTKQKITYIKQNNVRFIVCFESRFTRKKKTIASPSRIFSVVHIFIVQCVINLSLTFQASPERLFGRIS